MKQYSPYIIENYLEFRSPSSLGVLCGYDRFNFKSRDVMNI